MGMVFCVEAFVSVCIFIFTSNVCGSPKIALSVDHNLQIGSLVVQHEHKKLAFYELLKFCIYFSFSFMGTLVVQNSCLTPSGF